MEKDKRPTNKNKEKMEGGRPSNKRYYSLKKGLGRNLYSQDPRPGQGGAEEGGESLLSGVNREGS